MSLSRRRFIESASLTLLAGAARPVAFAQMVPRSSVDPFQDKNLSLLDHASAETFQPLVGEFFLVMRGNQQLESLILESVTSAEQPPSPSRVSKMTLSSKPAKEIVSSFALHFRGSGQSLSQGTYTMKNHTLGSLALFIVPGGPGMNPNTYTSTFTLLVL